MSDQRSLCWFNKEGDYLNINYNNSTQRYEGDLLFHENSSDTFKTIGLHLFENIPSFEYEVPNVLNLEKFQLFNEHNINITGSTYSYENQDVTFIEPVNVNPTFYSKWISGENFEKKFPIGSKIVFDQQFLEFTNLDKSYTVVGTKKGSIMILSNLDNEAFANTYPGLTAGSFTGIKISNISTIGIYDYVTPSLDDNLSSWSEPSFYVKMHDDKKLNLIGFKYNQRVVTVENTNIIDDVYYIYSTDGSGLTSSNVLWSEIVLKTDLPLVYSGQIQIYSNKIWFDDPVPSILKPGREFNIQNSTLNQNTITVGSVSSFLGNTQLTYYATSSQVIYDNKIYQCIQAYTQSATISISPTYSSYWTDSIDYLPVNGSLSPESLVLANVYLNTNKFYYYHNFTHSIPVTLASFAEKYETNFDIFKINLMYDTNDGKLKASLNYSSKYVEVNFFIDTVTSSNISTIDEKYEYLASIEEDLITEHNKDISENWKYNIVFDDIDEWGILITINGLEYPEDVYWIYNGLTVDLTRTIDKTLRNWINSYHSQLIDLGIIPYLSYQGTSTSPYYNSIILTTEYPNVPLEFEVKVGTTADFHIEHSEITFYDLGNSLNITINENSYYTASSTASGTSSVSIPLTLSAWVEEHSPVLNEYGIYPSSINNLLIFNVKEQDKLLDINNISIEKSPLPGIPTYKITDKINGNGGVIITSNSMILSYNGTPPPGSFTSSFIYAGFATGMVVNVNNTIYPFDNQQYNILYLDDYKANFSYQGPFWGTIPEDCYSSPYKWVAFSLGFGATACLSTPTLIGGAFTYSAFTSSFATYIDLSKQYSFNSYTGTQYMVDILYTQISQNMYVLGDNLLSYNALDSTLNKTIVLSSTQSVGLRYNTYNNYLYAITKNMVNIVDPVLDIITSTISTTYSIYDCQINQSNGYVFITYENSDYVNIYNSSNTLITSIDVTQNSGKMIYQAEDNKIYCTNTSSDELYELDGSYGTVSTTYSITNLKDVLYYELDAVYCFGDNLIRIEDGTASSITGVTSGTNNFVTFDNIHEYIFVSTDSNLYAIGTDGTLIYSEPKTSTGHMAISQLDEDIYMSTITNEINIIRTTDGVEKFDIKFPYRILKSTYNPIRMSMWAISSTNQIIEINVAVSSTSTVTTSLTSSTDYLYGTLDPDYIAPEYLWIKSEPYIRRPRFGYTHYNRPMMKYVYKWQTDDIPEIFTYDFTGNLLATSGSYSYIGEKPLETITLNRYPNTNYDHVGLSEYQQTIFDEIIFNLDYINSDTNISYKPEALSTFIGYNSENEGYTSSVLLLVERENVTLGITTSDSNLNTISLYSVSDKDYDAVIELDINSSNNFLYDELGNSTGLREGQLIKVTISDISNSKNKFISFNNGKIFKIYAIYNRQILLTYIEDIIIDESTIIENYPKAGEITYLYTQFDTIDKEIARFNVKGQTEIEDERYRIELSNTGHLISSDDIYIFKEYDINEQGIDWGYLNMKRKELLMVRHDIYPYIGSYKSIINAINYFGYNDLQLYEYYRNVNPKSDHYQQLVKVEIPDIFDNTVEGWTENDFIKNTMPNENYMDTNLFNLTYLITDKLGNNLLKYSLLEVLIKLGGLKKWLQTNIIPISHRIFDITGRADFVGTTNIKHKSYDATIVNQRQKLAPVNFDVTEAYLMPVNSGSSVYNVVLELSVYDTEIGTYSKFLTATHSPDYFNINVRTYKTYTEWQPLTTYQTGDKVNYYNQIYESKVDNNRLNNPKKYDYVSNWSISTTYVLGDLVNYLSEIYNWTGTTHSYGPTPVLDSNWINVTRWKKINYEPVQHLKEFRTNLDNYSFTVDSNIDPYIIVEVTSDNGYGQIYTVKKNYEIRGLKDVTNLVEIISADPLPIRI